MSDHRRTLTDEVQFVAINLLGAHQPLNRNIVEIEDDHLRSTARNHHREGDHLQQTSIRPGYVADLAVLQLRVVFHEPLFLINSISRPVSDLREVNNNGTSGHQVPTVNTSLSLYVLVRAQMKQDQLVVMIQVPHSQGYTGVHTLKETRGAGKEASHPCRNRIVLVVVAHRSQTALRVWSCTMYPIPIRQAYVNFNKVVP